MEQLGHYSWTQKMFPKLDSVFVFGKCIENEAPEKQKLRKYGVKVFVLIRPSHDDVDDDDDDDAHASDSDGGDDDGGNE